MVKNSHDSPNARRRSAAKARAVVTPPAATSAEGPKDVESTESVAVVVEEPEANALGDEELQELSDNPDDGAILPPLGDDEVISDEELERATLSSDVVEAPEHGPRTRSLVKSDPLTAYMHEIRRYPLLSREEEHLLAVEYAQNKSPEIGRRLITANLRLVVKIAHEYRRAYKNLLDLVQEGNLGLLQAVQKYDPYRGVKLSSYAAWWIRAYMLKFILNNWRLVKIGTTQAQRKLFFNLSKEKEKLELAGVAPTSQVLAQRLSVPEQEVTDMQMRLAASETSLDAPVSRDEEGGRTQLEMLESSGASRPDVTAESHEFQQQLREKLEVFEATLKGREQTLFHERLMSDQPLTLQEVGERYGISRERARQLEARLLGRLKVYLKRELGDAVQIAMGLD